MAHLTLNIIKVFNINRNNINIIYNKNCKYNQKLENIRINFISSFLTISIVFLLAYYFF